MVQGASFKRKGSNQPKKDKQKSGKLTKGAKVIAPKKSSLIKTQTLHKKLSAKISRNIEQDMAGKALSSGKLTIMKSIGQEGLAAGKGKGEGKKK